MEKVKRYKHLIKEVHQIYCDKCETEMYLDYAVTHFMTTDYYYICRCCGNVLKSDTQFPYIEYTGELIDE